MKHTLEGFSQQAAISLKKEIVDKKTHAVKVLKLDHTDLILLRWFVDFYPKIKKKIVNEVQYAWVNYQSIVDDLPLLNIEKRPVYNRFSKMCELGILKHYHDKDGGSFSYYGFGENYNLLKERYTTILQSITTDSRLSLKDLGLLVKLLSLPDNWNFSERGLAKILEQDGQTSIRTAIKNLENYGYLKRIRTHDEKGKVTGVEWIVNEEPETKKEGE